MNRLGQSRRTCKEKGTSNLDRVIDDYARGHKKFDWILNRSKELD